VSDLEAKKAKLKYGMWSNTRFMLSRAWRGCRVVLLVTAAQVVLGVAMNLLELFVTPGVLRAIETARLPELITTILFFSLGLILVGAASAYVDENILPGRVSVRLGIVNDIHGKFAAVSYPLTGDQDFLKKAEAAGMAASSNQQATEAVWTTLAELAKSLIGFAVYLALLAALDPVLILVTAVTAVGGYFASRRTNSWGYRHRDEEADYYRKTAYIWNQSKHRTLAKDIRIFNMRVWLEDMYAKTLRLFEDFCAREQRVYFGADLIDVALAFARNGFAYGCAANEGSYTCAYQPVIVAGRTLASSSLTSAFQGCLPWPSSLLRR